MTKRLLVMTVACNVSLAALALSLAGCGAANHRPTATPTPRPDTSAALVAAGVPTSSSTAGMPETITTSGTGTVNGTPDTLSIGVGVSTSATHAASALSQNNSIATAVQQALERDGVPAVDIQTTGLSLQAQYPPQPAGFQVYDEVTATLHNMSRAGSIIDDALAPAGDAGRLDYVNLSMSDTSPLVAAARQRAVAAARTEAQQLAAAAGAHVG